MRKIILIIVFLLFPTLLSAQEKIYLPSDFPNDELNKIYFGMVGKEFVAKKDNPCVLKKFGIDFYGNPSRNKQYTFHKNNGSQLCTKEYCDRKILYSNQKFKIENIVSSIDKPITITDGVEQTPWGKTDYTCENNLYKCYYKLKFEDGDIAYMEVFTLVDISSSRAVFENFPPQMQIYNPKAEKYIAKEFKKLGIKEGFTQSDVLNSSWGKPNTKIRSSINSTIVDVWFYDGGGIVDFEDGCVTQITTITH